MSKFLYLFRGGDARESNQSPEAMQEHMEKWKTWMGELAQKGTLVDGLPLDNHGKQVKGSSKVVTDGPFSEGKEIVGGYLVVKADDINEATELSKGCPILEFDDGHIEIREIMSMD